YAGKRAIWQKEGVQLPWAPNQDLSVELKLPEVKFDRLRIAVTPREGQWGGLAEVQVMRGGENVALGCPTFDSGNFDDRRGGGRVTDGIASSAVDTIGYWLLPHQGPGWVEIDLACLDPHLGAANRRLGAHLALVEGDWQRGLAWMARGDDEQLRMLAHADLDTVRDSAERLALGDAWWEFSAQARGKIKERLLARSIWRYRQVLSRVQEAQRRRIAARIDEVLPQLPERNHLFFMPELETVPWNWDFRELKIAANGAPSRYGLWMHATPNGSSHAAFSLGKRYVRFRGAAGINDSACGRTATALTFRIVADGRELWKSQPLKATGSSEPFNVSLAGVDKLELFVDCPGPNHWGHGVWLEPRLEE
ncbi:MAG TPA: NPCBM/NEW2 domain-containing protein, partial [Pirellulales bacterium]|nr:NPCBM/NEW2 domain-containing protein [Pirellulales bacterium]